MPVVGGAAPTIRQVIDSCVCEVVVDARVPEEIAQGIEKVASDRGLREELGKNGYKTMDSKHN